MDVIADPHAWAEQNFAATRLGDPRRTRRLVGSAARIARHPEKPFTQVFAWPQLRGFYRLCDQDEATTEAIQKPHWEATRRAMASHPLVLILHDTTELDFTTHPALKGAGPIGDGRGRGFLQHNSLAVVPHGAVLGLAYQQWKVRQAAPEHETSYQRKRRERESELWAQGFQASGRAPEGCCWVDVADRAGDDYLALQAARDQGHHFLVRAYQNRVAYRSAERGEPVHLMDFARSLKAQAADRVEITGRGGREARVAGVCLAAAGLWLPAPSGTPRRFSQPLIGAWVIRVWEPVPPPDVEEPLEWVLLCSLPTATPEELLTRRDWYALRPLIEVYHDVEKNGCSEEERRFETAERMEACCAVLAVVAVRVLQLRMAARARPLAPASEVATEAELGVLRRWLGRLRGRFTVRDFVRGVARLGGFLGRKGDGEPGVRALWRGYQRLQDMALGFHLKGSSGSGATRGPPTCG